MKNAEKNKIKKEEVSPKKTPNKNNSIKEESMTIVPLERSLKMIEAMQEAKIDLGLTPKQAFQIIQPTDPKFVRRRVVATTKTGKEIKASYVPGRFFELKLISVFGWNWRFEILKTEKTTREDGKREITKTGRLWFKLPNGEWNFVDRSGGAVSKEGIDDFNREKAAETDAFKRCCLALGFFNDVYAPVLGAEDRAIAESMEVNQAEEGEEGELIEKELSPIQEETSARIEEYEFEGKKYIRRLSADGKIMEEGINPDAWIPMFDVSMRRHFAGKGYSTWKKSPSPKQLEVIKAALERIGIKPENAVFRLNNRADRKVREKRIEQLDYGDAWDLCEIIVKKGKTAFQEIVVEIVPIE